MLGTNLTFTGVKGVGTVALELQPDQRVYTLIGANGVGKTKTLEALFQLLLFTHQEMSKLGMMLVIPETWVCSAVQSSTLNLQFPTQNTIPNEVATQTPRHALPVVFLASQNRGFIQHSSNPAKTIGSRAQRSTSYLTSLIHGMKTNFSSLNMNTGIEEWFVTLAQSSNRFQAQEDNREIEIKTVLKLMHDLDERIDPQFMEISGDGRVSLKIEGEKRELSHLSTGFASILKIIQAIVSGYGYFTNETQLQNVRGIVLIDEIESHLHISWQAHIIPLLKRLFPNTIFYITTHSSIVLSQLEEGEAYRLERDADGIVRTRLIQSPNKAAIVDLLEDAFGIDINRLKLENTFSQERKATKQELLSLLQSVWGE